MQASQKIFSPIIIVNITKLDTELSGNKNVLLKNKCQIL